MQYYGVCGPKHAKGSVSTDRTSPEIQTSHLTISQKKRVPKQCSVRTLFCETGHSGTEKNLGVFGTQENFNS